VENTVGARIPDDANPPHTLVHGAQLGLQVLHLLLVLALVLVALLFGGFPEMLQRLARMLVLFFQGLAMAFFRRDTLLQIRHLLDELLNECEQHLAYAGRNHLPFLLQLYKMVRAQLLNCIGIASPKASSEDQVVERLIEALYKLRDNRSDIVLLDTLGLSEDKDLRWMSAQWKRLVLLRPSGKGRAEAVHRRYFELAVMHAVKDDLKSGDLFIKYGERYDDYREQLVDDEPFEKEVGDYGRVTGIETNPGTFVTMLKSAMSQRARDIDTTFPENAHAEIVDGRLILRKPPRSEIVEAAARIDALITERMEAAGIVDVMIDTERWLDLHKLFRPLAGTDSRLEDLRMRVITTLFCYGCTSGRSRPPNPSKA
jgi:hypothetical protein